ncbi:MAG: permease-like cell division protein FtsX [Burkholderiales bacterium]|jgi:cell division transport system permease protein|nr:permease-like cell division protein FtsX [Burkholderiales bacterium]
MRQWLRLHRRAFADAAGRLARGGFGSVFDVLVMVLALVLPLALYLTLVNAMPAAGSLAADPELTVWMRPDASPAEVDAVGRALRTQAGADRVRFIPKADALARLERTAGLGDVVASLGRNPLPDAWVVTGAREPADTLDGLRPVVAALPAVDQVIVDTDSTRRLRAILRALRVATAALGVLLGVAVVAITFNTIGLQCLARREEIAVSRLLGATDAYIRRPFVWFGALQGVLGGLGAWAAAALGVALVDRELATVPEWLAGSSGLRALLPSEGLALVAMATALGATGAWGSVWRQLRDEAT